MLKSNFDELVKGRKVLTEQQYLELLENISKGVDIHKSVESYQVKDDYTNLTETLYVLPILEKSDKDELEKAGKGEGSRGGKVIGHTKSGKPIYDTHEHPSHKNFTKEDHEDAAEEHYYIGSHADEKGNEVADREEDGEDSPKAKKHYAKRDYHNSQGKKHEESSEALPVREVKKS